MEQYRAVIRRVTAVLLVTSAVLILPGLVGVGASVLFTVVLAMLGLGLVSVREELASMPTVLGCDLGQYASDLWLAPFVAAGLLVAFPGATAAELQALGGLAGFVGMVNYFLTPVYGFLYTTAVRLSRTFEST